ncbi:hypothetical protein ES703_14699 [subsurface metagenome]
MKLVNRIMRNRVLLCVLFAVAMVVNTMIVRKVSQPQAVYWAVFEDGHKRTMQDIIVFPITEPNDVSGIWPVYVMEVEVDFPLVGRRLTLRSKPFLLSENPEIQGEYGDRLVYYIPRPKK